MSLASISALHWFSLPQIGTMVNLKDSSFPVVQIRFPSLLDAFNSVCHEGQEICGLGCASSYSGLRAVTGAAWAKYLPTNSTLIVEKWSPTLVLERATRLVQAFVPALIPIS